MSSSRSRDRVKQATGLVPVVLLRHHADESPVARKFKRETAMKTLRLLPVGCLCFLLTACQQNSSPSSGSSPTSGLKDQLVGKWQETRDTEAEVMEFAKDGTMTFSMGPIEMKGKYKVESEGVLVMEMENPFDPGKTKAIKLKAALVKDELTLTNDEEKDEAKKVKKFKRK